MTLDFLTLEIAGRIAWAVFIVGWYLIRYQFNRRAKRVRIADDRMKLDERIRLTISFIGLGFIPGRFAIFGQPDSYNYPPNAILFSLGILVGIASLIMFRRTHKALGKMWSVSLQLKEDHKLVTSGIYRHLRHPMYSAFWLMALMQALLLPNWIAGLSGLIGFGALFFLRIGPEERMMEATFGDEWRAYRARTWRIIPYVY